MGIAVEGLSEFAAVAFRKPLHDRDLGVGGGVLCVAATESVPVGRGARVVVLPGLGGAREPHLALGPGQVGLEMVVVGPDNRHGLIRTLSGYHLTK